MRGILNEKSTEKSTDLIRGNPDPISIKWFTGTIYFKLGSSFDSFILPHDYINPINDNHLFETHLMVTNPYKIMFPIRSSRTNEKGTYVGIVSFSLEFGTFFILYIGRYHFHTNGSNG